MRILSTKQIFVLTVALQQIGTYLLRVPVSALLESEKFAAKYNITAEGSETPIVIEGVSLEDFEALLGVIFPHGL